MLRKIWHRVAWRVRPRGIRPCCRDPENLARTRLGRDAVVNICQVCGARHFVFKAEPGEMGAELKPLGNGTPSQPRER